MKTNTIKALFFSLLVTFAAVSVKANNTDKNPGVSKMEFSVINATTVEINSSIYVKAKETIEIQRSYDNKNFQTVMMVFGEEEKSNTQNIKFKDKVKKNSEVYYRVVKVQNGNIIPLTSSALVEL